MAAGWKLQKLAKERNTTEVKLLIWALENSATYEEAGAKLGITRNGVRKAITRYDIHWRKKMVVNS